MTAYYYQTLYAKLKPEYEALPNYTSEFDAAFNRAVNLPDGPMEMQIRAILTASLKAYANTSPTTKGGRIGRFFARIAAVIIPFIKFNK